MSQKISVTICTGTTCYILGGSQFLLLQEKLDKDLRKKVEIKGAPCMGLCKDHRENTPCVKIEDKYYIGLSLDELIQEIKTAVQGKSL